MLLKTKTGSSQLRVLDACRYRAGLSRSMQALNALKMSVGTARRVVTSRGGRFIDAGDRQGGDDVRCQFALSDAIGVLTESGWNRGIYRK